MTLPSLIAFLRAYANSANFAEPLPPKKSDAAWFTEAANALGRLAELEANQGAKT